MLKRILGRVGAALETAGPAEAGERRTGIRLATAALMVEVARADHEFDPEEFETLLRLIEKHFDLDADDAAALSDRAEQRVEESVSLHEFTSVLHGKLAPEDKTEIIELLWRVAYADGRLDMYEDAMVSKIGDLLYVPRSQIMRAKDAVAS